MRDYRVTKNEINFPEHQLLYCCASKDRKEQEIIFKAVNVNSSAVQADVVLENPENVIPVHKVLKPGELVGYEFPAYSVTIALIN